MGRINKRLKYQSDRQDLRRIISSFLMDLDHWVRWNPDALRGKEKYKIETILKKLEDLKIEVQGYYFMKFGGKQIRCSVDQDRLDIKNSRKSIEDLLEGLGVVLS